jgi:hypothetical protein
MCISRPLVCMQAGFTAEHYAPAALKKLLASPAGAAVAAPPMPEQPMLATSSSGAVTVEEKAPAGKAEKVRQQQPFRFTYPQLLLSSMTNSVWMYGFVCTGWGLRSRSALCPAFLSSLPWA